MSDPTTQEQTAMSQETPLDDHPTIVAMQRRISTLQEAATGLLQRLQRLEQATTEGQPEPPEEKKIQELLERIYPVKLTLQQIAEETDAAENTTYNALRRMIRRGKVIEVTRKNEGSSKTFHKFQAPSGRNTDDE